MIHFTLKQLEIFIAVAQHLSISDAARALHLTQPAISQQIHKIELIAGKKLFEQLGKKIYLTETGKFLLGYANNIIEQAELFKEACHSEKLTTNGKLRVGVGIPLQMMFFNVLRKFNLKYSFSNIEYYDGDRNKQLEYLHENKTDFCVLVHPVNSTKLISEMINELPMAFIISPHHPLSAKKNIVSRMLLNETFIICEEGSANYVIMKKLFKKLNNKPNLIKIKDQNAVKHAVMANLGVSVLPQHMLQIELNHQLITPLSINDFSNPMTSAFWIQHANKKLSPLARLFKTFLFDELKNINTMPLPLHNKVEF